MLCNSTPKPQRDIFLVLPTTTLIPWTKEGDETDFTFDIKIVVRVCTCLQMGIKDVSIFKRYRHSNEQVHVDILSGISAHPCLY